MHALLKTTNEIPLPINRTLQLAEQVNPILGNDTRRRLRYMHAQSFDWQEGGLLSAIKFIDRDSVEYSLLLSSELDKNEERMARMTLDNAMDLSDPVWGGVFQYSTQGVWNKPHHRKTIAAQSGHLRLYSLAYAQLQDKNYLNLTNTIQSYIKNFMTSDFGAFYTGQTDTISGLSPLLYFKLSDDQRRQIGIPDVDKRLLSRENGWMIEALAAHHEFCGNKESFNMAICAANWVNHHCRKTTGAYVSHTMTNEPLHLADTLAMARAMLQLYRCTLEQTYLDYACESANYIYNHFKNEICGFNSQITSGTARTHTRQMDENISLVRFANLLSHYRNEQIFSDMAKHGLRYLCIPEVATARMEEAGILLVDRETHNKPLRIELFGHKHSPLFNDFLNIAHKHPGWYKLIRYTPSKLVYASIEIDGFKSKQITCSKKLEQLLETY